MSKLIWAAGFSLLATSALAQTGSNVVPPRSESQVGSINQSITSQQQGRAAAQQNQFETNALRTQITQPPAPPVMPGTSGIVAPR